MQKGLKAAGKRCNLWGILSYSRVFNVPLVHGPLLERTTFMNLSVSQFVNVAKSNWFNNDIVLTGAGNIKSKFFSSKVTEGSRAWTTNQATMDAFKEALTQEYGIFGEDSFERLLQGRADKGLALRKNDILKVVEDASMMRDTIRGGLRGLSELRARVMVEQHPACKGLDSAQKAQVMKAAIKQMETDLKDNQVVFDLGREIVVDPDYKMERVSEDAWSWRGQGLMERRAAHETDTYQLDRYLTRVISDMMAHGLDD